MLSKQESIYLQSTLGISIITKTCGDMIITRTMRKNFCNGLKTTILSLSLASKIQTTCSPEDGVKTTYNPDFCWVSSKSQMRLLPSSRTVFPDLLHNQHRPVVIDVGVQIPFVESTLRPRQDFNKTKWLECTKELDARIRFIHPKTKNFHRSQDWYFL